MSSYSGLSMEGGSPPAAAEEEQEQEQEQEHQVKSDMNGTAGSRTFEATYIKLPGSPGRLSPLGSRPGREQGPIFD